MNTKAHYNGDTLKSNITLTITNYKIMGWMRTLLLGDIGNRLDIADTEKGLASMRANQKKTVQNLHARDKNIESLEQELGQQKLAIQALTRFLIEKDMIEEEELDSFIEQVDAEDGVVDGKIHLDSFSRKLIFTSAKKIEKGTFKPTQ
jgi:hypothetical protein